MLSAAGDSLIGDEQDVALADFWKQPFSKQHENFDEPLADQIADQFFSSLPSVGSCFNTTDFTHLLSRAKSSAPGPDGVTFLAWRCAGAKAAETLALAGHEVCSGCEIPREFNSSLVVLPPKNTVAAELNTGASRALADTRPLNLKNCSNKAICGVVNAKMTAAVSAWASPIQNGFIRGRALTVNVPLLDTAARMYAFRDPAKLPCLSLFDFKAAFPSVSWKWMFKLVDRAGLPEGMKIANFCCMKCSQEFCRDVR